MGYFQLSSSTEPISSISVFIQGDNNDLFESYDPETGGVYFDSVDDGNSHSYIVVIRSVDGSEVHKTFSVSCAAPVPIPIPIPVPVPIPVPLPVYEDFEVVVYGASCGNYYQLVSCANSQYYYTDTPFISGKYPVKNGVRYYYTGNTINQSTPPISFIGSVNLMDGSNGCDDTGATECENQANPHIDANTYGSPHHFASTEEVALVGVLRSEQGEVNAYGVWVSCFTLGYQRNTSNRIAGYKIPYNYPVNVATRTKDGCTVYPDYRTTEYFTGNFSVKKNLVISPNGNHAYLPITAIKINMNMYSTSANDIFGIFFPGNVATYKVRINSGSWISSSLVGSGDFAGHTVTGGQAMVPKDFILDITNDNGATFDRFVCRGNTVGGHFGSYYTITRLRDGNTFLSTTLGRIDTTSFIRYSNNYKVYAGIFGDCFDMGIVNSDTNVIFGFESGHPPVDFLSIKMLSKDN